MAVDSIQGTQAALADINGLIATVQGQIASVERSIAFQASIGQVSPLASRLPGLRAELAGYQTSQAQLTQLLGQLEAAVPPGATGAPALVPVADSLAPNEAVVTAPGVVTAAQLGSQTFPSTVNPALAPVPQPNIYNVQAPGELGRGVAGPAAVPVADSLAPNETLVGPASDGGIPEQTAEEAQNEANFLAGLKNNAKSQGTLQSRYKQPGNGDWRVRLSLAPNSNYLYNAGSAAGILAPLTATNGVIFPYTPTISTTYSAEYEKYNLTHSNYRGLFYKSSGVGDVQINGTFTAQDTREAAYLLAVIHFFRSVTKMFYGQDAQRGTPPPLVYLSGYGDQQFSNHACVVSSFNYSLPNGVDYIRTNGPNNFGLNMSNRQNPIAASPGGSNFSGAIRLANALLKKGALPQVPAQNTLLSAVNNTNECSYVPTKMEIDITLIPVQTRSQVSKQFSLEQFASGRLLKGGFW